jgi:hypothetical protein
MKLGKRIGILLSLAITCFAADPFTSGSAFTMAPGRWEVGVFQPLRYGWSSTTELSTHPLWFFIMPNAAVKWSHGTKGGWQLASRHSFYYPTWLLRMMAKEGIGGIISPEFAIPHMLGLHNQVLASRQWPNTLITLHLGLGLGLKSSELDERTTIDLPIVFPRLNIFYHGYNWYTGVDVQRSLGKKWQGCMGAQMILCPLAKADFTLEQTAWLWWVCSAHVKICAGYKLVYGEYPFGTQWHLLPLLDVLMRVGPRQTD